MFDIGFFTDIRATEIVQLLISYTGINRFQYMRGFPSYIEIIFGHWHHIFHILTFWMRETVDDEFDV